MKSEINELREKLYSLIDINNDNLLKKEIIELSQKLDKLIIKYQSYKDFEKSS